MCVCLNLYVVRLRSNNSKRTNEQTTKLCYTIYHGIWSISINRNSQVTQYPYTYLNVQTFFFGLFIFMKFLFFTHSYFMAHIPNSVLYRLFNFGSSPLLLIARCHIEFVDFPNWAHKNNNNNDTTHPYSEFMKRMKSASGLENDRTTEKRMVVEYCLFICLFDCVRVRVPKICSIIMFNTC